MGVLRLDNDSASQSSSLCARFSVLASSYFFWPCADRLAESKLLVPYVELGNDDSE
jgi:hypothetical protein